MSVERYTNAYAEVLHYLKGIKRSDISKIPKGLIYHFERFKNSKYICDFDYTKPLKELNLLEETKGLIGMICLKYWCDTDEKKQKLIENMNINELKHQEKLKKIYNTDNLFKKKKSQLI